MESRVFSQLYRDLRPGVLKALYQYARRPGMISLAGGLPMESTFAYKKVSVTMRDGRVLDIANNKACSPSERTTYNLDLQYGLGEGLPDLKDWVVDHMRKLHKPKYDDWTSALSVGSTDATFKLLSLLDSGNKKIICDQYTYSGFLNAAHIMGFHTCGIPGDSEGMLPSALQQRLRAEKEKGSPVRLLYLIPTAQNPSGVSMSQRRLDEIYDICCEHDVTILEDDSYYYLTFQTEQHRDRVPGLDLPASLFARDVQSRVVRMDSVSKTICPGMRLGWVTGPSDIILRFKLFQEMSTQSPSGWSMSIFHAMVKELGDEGFERMISETQEHYKRQSVAMLEAVNEYLSPYCEWVTPTSGMFIWFKLKFDLPMTQLFEKMVEHNVILVPGYGFLAEPPAGFDSLEAARDAAPYLRATFSTGTPETMKEGLRRLSETIEAMVRERGIQV